MVYFCINLFAIQCKSCKKAHFTFASIPIDIPVTHKLSDRKFQYRVNITEPSPCALAVSKVQTGVTDYQSAMREVMKAMADSGIRTVDYATGYSRRLESAVRQNILWGVKQCNQNTADMIGKEFGADGYEISYHSHPRPSHADMGGKQFAIGGARWVNGTYYPSFEEKAEPLLNEFGCLHFKFSILLGISEPAYSEEQLTEYKANDNRKFEFEGKEYTRYEAGQLQKRIESEVRRQKDRANIAKAAGDDIMRREAQYKINLLTNKYAKLSKESGLPTKMERMQMKGFRSVKGNQHLTFIENQVIIKEKSGLPKKLVLPDEKIKQTVDVNFDFLHGVVPHSSEATNVYVMAGDGTSVPIRDVKRLYLTYNKNPQGWQKKSADVYTENYKYVVHWYEHNGFAPADEFKIKGVKKL